MTTMCAVYKGNDEKHRWSSPVYSSIRTIFHPGKTTHRRGK